MQMSTLDKNCVNIILTVTHFLPPYKQGTQISCTTTRDFTTSKNLNIMHKEHIPFSICNATVN